jgi:hypothetical protein
MADAFVALFVPLRLLSVLLAVLGIAFIGESIRSSADIVDDQSLLLAWPWALLISCASWVLATVAGPFEATRMLTILLNEWLPANVDGVSRSHLIAELVPPSARWWVAFGPMPIIAVIWAYQAKRHGGFTQLQEFRSDDPPSPVGARPARPVPSDRCHALTVPAWAYRPGPCIRCARAALDPSDALGRPID